MRTTPKYFLILAVMAGAAVVSASCASDGPSTGPARDDLRMVQANLKDAHDKYDWIGKYHTDGLAYVYSQLAKGGGKARTQKEMCGIAAKATKEFHKAQRHGDVPAGLVDPALVGNTCPSDDGGISSKTVLASGLTRKTDLSSGAVSLIDQITYLTSTATSRSALVDGVLNVESQAGYLSPDDAGAVIAVGSVALSSVDYWEANLDAWVALPGTMATAYSVSATAPTTGPRYGAGWWQYPVVKGLRKVLAADALAAARSVYASWYMGPIGWDAAAAASLFASATTAVALLF
ncbi:MAG TPA: hypothetical protein VM053_08170 [Gemmatimonadaceae bacterium]|nr:hypothetical protein [Gemmatimonadaceae bacterium]